MGGTSGTPVSPLGSTTPTLVGELLNSIEWHCQMRHVRPPDRVRLRVLMADQFREITGKGDFSWAKMKFSTSITTTEGTRYYLLPHNFSHNFEVDPSTGVPCCKLHDGVGEKEIKYISPEEYWGKNLDGQANGIPTEYTVMHQADGTKLLYLSPPPDDNGGSDYTIDGIYIPSYLDFDDDGDYVPLPGDVNVLVYAVVRFLIPDYEPQYQTALANTMLREARLRKAQIRPKREVS